MWFDLFLFAIAAYLVKKVFWSRKPPAPLPPGPKPLPLLGNYFDVPSRGLRATYTEWATKFGDISYVKIFRNRLVVVNSSKVATNMLDKKGAKYSDRPVVPMAGELVGGKDMLSFAQYGDRFRETRKLSHRAIGSPTAAASYQGIQEAQTRKFLQRLYASPEKLSSHIRTNAGALILKIVYGYEVKEENDPFVNLVENAIRAIATAVITGTFLVDAVPILKYVPEWFPGAGFKVQARKWNVLIQDMANKPFQLVKERMAAGTAVRSFTSDLLEGRSLTGEDEFLVKWAAASMYAGGGDTTVGSIYAFFLAMTLFPEIQKKAQAEIDAVVGSERLPTFADRERLPYIDAIVKEVLRWHVIFPLGIAHRSTEDDIHDGYYIPKGSRVIPNLWFMLHDPRSYADPLTFRPERFLSEGGKTPETDPRTICFGFGRRICPGMHLADASIWISAAMSLSVFNISKYVENGVEITPVYEPSPGGISHPKPFKCTITPRSTGAIALIQQEVHY